MKKTIAAILLILSSSEVHSQQPDCSGEKRWATMMAFAQLKNAGLVKNKDLEFSKTKTVRLASEELAMTYTNGH